MIFKRYINNISGLQAFQLLRYGTLLLISIVFAQSGMSTSSIGNYEMFLFVAALLCSFWINGLIQSFLPLFRNNSTFGKSGSKSPEIFNVFVFVSVLSLLMIFLLLLLRQPFSSVLTHGRDIPYLKLLVGYIFFSSPSFLIEYIYLLKNKAAWIINYGVITFGAQLVAVAGPALAGMDMKMCVFGLVAIAFLRYIWLLFLLKKYACFAFSLAFIKEHFHLAYPLIISSLLGSSAQYVDGFLVLNKFDSATFAIFQYGAKEFPLVLLMANALSTAMIPDFISRENLQDALRKLRKKSAQLMHFLFPVTLCFLLLSKWLYPRIFNDNFSESAVVFNIYLLLIISRLTFPHTIIIGLKKTSVIMFASLAELLINIGLSVIFIRFWGIEGIAFATVIAFAMQKIIFVFYNKKVLNIGASQYLPISILLFYSILTVATFCFIFW